MLVFSLYGLYTAVVTPSMLFLSVDVVSLKRSAASFMFINLLPVQKNAATTCSALEFEARFPWPWNAGTCTGCSMCTCDTIDH